MRARIKRICRDPLAKLWLGVREWCGDAAYERYLQCAARRQDGSPVLTAAQFYVEQMHRKYSRPNRCC
jgi:uncharacterized short protein YbdD (DUF466 family)